MVTKIETHLPELHGEIKSLLERPSMASEKAKAAFGGSEALAVAQKELTSKITHASKAFKQKLETLTATAESRLTKFKSFSDKDGIAKVGKEANFKTAQEELSVARKEIVSLFEGNLKDVKDDGVTKAFGSLQETVGKAKGLLDGHFGRLQVEGFSKTARQNLSEFKTVTKKITPTLAFRGVGLVAAGAAISDAVLRSKSRDGEDRSFIARGAELLAGVGAGGTALLAGRAL